MSKEHNNVILIDAIYNPKDTISARSKKLDPKPNSPRRPDLGTPNLFADRPVYPEI
jgi:hypothetical protein